MRLVDKYFKDIKETDIDLTKGYITTTLAVKADAEPIDDISKFAWNDDDMEEVQMYIENIIPECVQEENKKEQEYKTKLNALEADIKEIKGLFSNLLKKLNIKEEII